MLVDIEHIRDIDRGASDPDPASGPGVCEQHLMLKQRKRRMIMNPIGVVQDDDPFFCKKLPRFLKTFDSSSPVHKNQIERAQPAWKLDIAFQIGISAVVVPVGPRKMVGGNVMDRDVGISVHLRHSFRPLRIMLNRCPFCTVT